MRATGLRMKDYLAHPTLDLDLSDGTVHVFVGKNGTGKSSILDAVRAALTGTARGVPRKDSRRLARYGQDTWRVEVDVEAGDAAGTIRRTPTTLNSVDGDGVKHTLNQSDLVDLLLGGEPRVVDALFNAPHALDMTADQLRALVYTLAGVEVTEDYLRNAGLSFEPAVEAALAGNWRKAVRVLEYERRLLQRQAEDLDLEPPEDPTVGAPGCESMRASEVDDEVLADTDQGVAEYAQEARDLRDELATARGTAAGAREAIEAQLADMETLDVLEGRVRNLAGRVSDMEAELEPVRADLAKEEGNLRKAQAALEAAQAAQAAAGRGGTCTCSTCGHVHERPSSGTQDPATLDEAVAAAEKRLRDQVLMVEGGRKVVGELGATMRDLERQLSGAEAQVATRKGLESRLANVVDEGPAVADPDKLERKAQDLEARAEAGRQIVAIVEEYRRARQRHDQQLARKKDLGGKALALQKQEALVKPDGLPAQLLGATLDPLRYRLSNVGRDLFGEEEGYQGVYLDDEFQLHLVDRDGALCAVDTANTSARWRASVALADALADLSGLRFLILDEITLLDGDNRNALLLALASLQDSYDQVLVAAVLGDNPPTQPPADVGIRVWTVDPGHVVLV